MPEVGVEPTIVQLFFGLTICICQILQALRHTDGVSSFFPCTDFGLSPAKAAALYDFFLSMNITNIVMIAAAM